MKSIEPFITGFIENNDYVGRPADVEFVKDGSMLISITSTAQSIGSLTAAPLHVELDRSSAIEGAAPAGSISSKLQPQPSPGPTRSTCTSYTLIALTFVHAMAIPALRRVFA